MRIRTHTHTHTEPKIIQMNFYIVELLFGIEAVGHHNGFKIFFENVLFYMYEYFACMCVCAPCICLVLEDSIGSPGTGVTDDCEPPCGCWKWDLHPLEEQAVLSATDSSPVQQMSFKIERQSSCKAVLGAH